MSINKKILTGTIIIGLLAGAEASARVNVDLNIGQPAPVYMAPAPVYAPPQPVYVAPQPVYVEPYDPHYRKHYWHAHHWDHGHDGHWDHGHDDHWDHDHR